MIMLGVLLTVSITLCRISFFGIFMTDSGNKKGYLFLVCSVDGFQNCARKGRG